MTATSLARRASPKLSSSSTGISTQITRIDTGIDAGVGEPVGSADRHRIGIAHQHQRRIGMALTKFRGDVEDISGLGASGEAADIRGLNRGAVGHRIGERHAELDDVRAACDERVEDGTGIGRGRIASGDEGDERCAVGGEGL